MEAQAEKLRVQREKHGHTRKIRSYSLENYGCREKNMAIPVKEGTILRKTTGEERKTWLHP